MILFFSCTLHKGAAARQSRFGRIGDVRLCRSSQSVGQSSPRCCTRLRCYLFCGEREGEQVGK